jgi:CubicO group peptidase (beta-lactamase class C family)
MVAQTEVVRGEVDPNFEPVRQIFERQFVAGEHVGAGVAVYHRGEKVVDLWGGLANRDTGAAWERRTMAISMSTTKGLTATCLHMLADRGLVEYEAPVARYWPEFARNGKESITVYHLLTHQAGLAPVPVYGADLLDWDAVVHGLEEMAPEWEPGTAIGYHAFTFGHLVGEVIRRVSRKSVGGFLRDEVCAPLGLEDMHIGAPPSAEPRIAKLEQTMLPAPGMVERMQERLAAGEPLISPLTERAMGIRPGTAISGEPQENFLDTPAGHQAEVPAANGVMTARDLARLYACLANYGQLDGIRLMSADRVRVMSKVQTRRRDLVLGIEPGWALGYMTGGAPLWPQGMRETAFGHPGVGGSVGFCDPEINMAFGFTTNGLAMDPFGFGRAAALAEAARISAEAIG